MHPDKQKFILQMIVVNLAFTLPFLWLAYVTHAPFATKIGVIAFISACSFIGYFACSAGKGSFKYELLTCFGASVILIVSGYFLCTSDQGLIIMFLLSIGLFLVPLFAAEILSSRLPYYQQESEEKVSEGKMICI